MTRTDENRETCKRIANTIESIISGNLYKCPNCGEFINWEEWEQSEHRNDDLDTCYTCPNCDEEITEEDLEPVSLWDYFNDVFDIEYRIGSDRQLRSVQIMVACGGPNIYVDTATKAVELYWWTERASYYLSEEAVEAVNDLFEELYNC